MSNPIPNSKPWKKGQSGNPKGRPRKLVNLMADKGYKPSEVRDCMLIMIGLDQLELKQVEDNPDSTILETTIAASLLKSRGNKSLYNILEIIDRVVERPKQSHDVNQTTTHIIDPESWLNKIFDASEVKPDGEKEG